MMIIMIMMTLILFLSAFFNAYKSLEIGFISLLVPFRQLWLVRERYADERLTTS